MDFTRKSYPENFVLRSVSLWNPEGVRENVDVTVEKGRVAALRPGSGEAGRYVLMPAGVDAQVHLRVPGQTHKETAETGLAAAIWGGYQGLLTMPNTTPVIDSVEMVARTREEIEPARSRFGVEVLISAAATLGQRGERLADMEKLAQAGVAAFTDDGLGVRSDELMGEAFRRLADLGLPFLQHAEMPGHGGVLAPGPVQRRLGIPAYSADPEVRMVERDLRLLEAVPETRYHVLHVSSRETLDRVAAARGRGLRASCEVSPHHLWFSCEDIEEGNLAFKMNPPLRSPEDREALRAGLADGRVDFVATDHAPHDPASKGSEFTGAAFGTVGMETALRVLLALWQRGELSAPRLVEVFSTGPARFLGMDGSWGRIGEGAPLRALLVDPHAEQRPVDISDIKSLSKNSCFLGASLPGRLLYHFTPEGYFSVEAGADSRAPRPGREV